MIRKKVEHTHEEAKKAFEKELDDLEEMKDADISDLEKRYNDLRLQKEMQDRQN